jgi:Protein phosphatase 2C
MAANVGTSHVRAGLPCQDRIACSSVGTSIIAVAADGAGSARFSDVGADLVVTTIVNILQSYSLDDAGALPQLLRSAVDHARSSVLALADERRVPAREFASTLLAIVATEDGAACAHIGDGVIAVSEGGEDWSWLFWPDRGEFANTTYFLTDDNSHERLRIEAISNPITDFALLTDGLEPLAVVYANQTVHNPFFNSIFFPLHQSKSAGCNESLSVSLTEFLASPRVTSRVDDDLSIVIASRRPSTLVSP